VRFLGRRVYAGFIVVLLAAMTHGLSEQRVEQVRRTLKVDPRTLSRWRDWWLENFVESSFWKAARARFLPPLCQASLPWSLCQRFDVELRAGLVALLEFLTPLSITPANHAL